MEARLRVVVPLLCLFAAAACSEEPERDVATPEAGRTGSVTVRSAAFQEGSAIPERYTCDGAGVSPPLTWDTGGGPPRAWALVVDDPDAPGGTYTHWVVLDIPAASRSVAAGAKPAGAVESVTSAGRTGYAPPCPPSGTHRYRFTVYALSARTGLPDGTPLTEALNAIRSADLVHGTLTGTYRRH